MFRNLHYDALLVRSHTRYDERQGLMVLLPCVSGFSYWLNCFVFGLVRLVGHGYCFALVLAYVPLQLVAFHRESALRAGDILPGGFTYR